MIAAQDLLIFTGICLMMVLTPGPNMIYLISRSICQGRRAGVISLFGIVSGLTVHVLAAAVGLSALFMAVPFAYELLKYAGAGYLLWMAWQSVKPGARSPLEPQDLPHDSPRKLYAMGMVTSILNPKVAMLYLSIFPQFVSPTQGSVFWQSLTLGGVQMATSFTVNLMIALSAAGIASWFSRHPTWLATQRYVMGSVLAALAFKLALEPRRG
jgi:threonine/homoserine/homoserine lactone efflux protein